jgi:hypothetical protein
VSEKKKQFFKVPQDIKTMTDEQLDQWAGEIIDLLITDHNKDERQQEAQ